MRGPGFVILLSIGFLGGSLMAFLPEDGPVAGRLVGNYAANTTGSSLPLMYSYAGANYAGHTKKATINAVALIAFCVGNIIGPLTFRDEDAPDYIPAKIAMVVATCFAAIATRVLMFYYKWENSRRDRLYAGAEHTENSEFFDLIDRENHEFRVSEFEQKRLVRVCTPNLSRKPGNGKLWSLSISIHTSATLSSSRIRTSFYSALLFFL
jgi:hypothetical protein